MTNKVALIVAIVLGVLAVLGIKIYVEKMKGDVEHSQQLVEVLVAARDLRAGEEVTAKDIEGQRLSRPAVEALKQTNVGSRESITGRKTIKPVRAGQIFQDYHFNVAKAQRQPIEIPADMRAVTIPVNAVTGMAGLIKPGDYVDLVCAFELAEGASGSTRQVARTLAKKVLVLATDAFSDPRAEVPLASYATVTVRLKPLDANRVVFILATKGVIQLVKLADAAPDTPSWDAIGPDKLYKEVEAELRGN